MNTHALSRQQGGFALVGAIFLLVIVAAFGTFALSSTSSQRYASDLQLLTARAQAAAEAGLEAAAMRLQTAPSCASLSAPFAVAGGFTVSYPSCNQSSIVVGTTTVNIFDVGITATTTQAGYGTPGFASRTVRARIAI